MDPGAAVLDMAKKKAGKPGPKPVGGGRVATTPIRSTEAWKAWVEELAQFDRSTVSDVVDHALVAYARSIGFPKIAPQR
jgi:hypothetical protein